MQLNQDNLSKCCGPNCIFLRLCIAAELRNNKAHAKKSKDKLTIDGLFKKILQVILAHAYRKLPQRVYMAS